MKSPIVKQCLGVIVVAFVCGCINKDGPDEIAITAKQPAAASNPASLGSRDTFVEPGADLVEMLKTMPQAYELSSPSGLGRAKSIARALSEVSVATLAEAYWRVLEEPGDSPDNDNRLCTLNRLLFEMSGIEVMPLVVEGVEVVGSDASDMFVYHRDPIKELRDLALRYRRRDYRWTHGHTDERGFTRDYADAHRNGRQAKIWAWATIDSMEIGWAKPVPIIKYGPSNALSTKSSPYREKSGTGVVGLWQNIIRAGYQYGNCISWAAFEIQACSPFIPRPLQNFQACINFVVYVRFLAVRDRVHVLIEHSHDKFPDYEAFVFEPQFCILLRYPTPYTVVSEGGLGQSTAPATSTCAVTAPTSCLELAEI